MDLPSSTKCTTGPASSQRFVLSRSGRVHGSTARLPAAFLPCSKTLCQPRRRPFSLCNRNYKAICRATLLSPQLVFDGLTVCVMPLYALMIWAPQHVLTKSLVGDSKIPFYLGAALYLSALACWNPLPVIWNSLTSSMSGQLLPNLSVFASTFSHSETTVLTWINLLLMDLYQAR